MKIKPLILIFILFFISPFAKSQPHLEGMPSPEDVVAKIKGVTPRETYAKQIAALRILWSMIRLHEMDKYHQKDTPKETMLLKNYSLWQKKLRDEYSATYENLGDSAADASFRIYCSQLRTNELRNYIIENLFNNAAKERYYEIAANKPSAIIQDPPPIINPEVVIEAERERIKTLKRVAGMSLMMIPSLIYIFWAGRRRFNRTNKYGVEEFKSWGDMTFKRLLEEFAGIGVGILVLAGIWLLITSIGN